MTGIVIEPILISTYARFILSQSIALAESIELSSLPVDRLKRIASGENPLQLEGALSAESIAIALAGPAKPILLDSMQALARVLQTRLEVHLTAEEIFVRDKESVNPQKLNKDLLKKASVVECDSLLQKCDAHAGETFDQYQELLHKASQQLIALINEQIVPLNDHESHELLFQESIEDLKGRMLDLNLNWPKLNYDDFTIVDYVALKAYIAVYNALNRLQMPHDDKVLQKQFKAILKLIKTVELKQQMDDLLNHMRQTFKELTGHFPAVSQV